MEKVLEVEAAVEKEVVDRPRNPSSKFSVRLSHCNSKRMIRNYVPKVNV